ncbi:CRISPR locus-related DNA-binding protein [Methanobacterium alkalithermotolerans]|uniref:CRISPR locus-related DNA-binding protein n=1 Tax=Methanobacterium alkalithermotolerans TaxID=2731220 RepID=A0A8T8K1S7_9EURY|nr:CRISPR-associated CARF protein Csa3 [Methanobacterium alkalithermotolerans]QUH22338.1 CRISPR locus-related DNA-binding protein [Methanobacterium alkalithermotolerans]RJS49663.1 MAG: CRISPR-associated transcriptional regulator Csa3 [Methanobacterium sp.]
METTMISTIYSIEPVMICITQFSPKKVVLLREDKAPDEKNKVEQILNDTVGKFIEIVSHETSLYDVVRVAQDTADVIDEEKAAGRRVVVNISGGRKPQALGALFGCYARHQEVERIVYVTEEDSELIDLPILNFGISKTKKQVLESLINGESSVKNLAIKIGISRGMTYNHIRELREMGFIDQNKLEITSAGQLAVI